MEAGLPAQHQQVLSQLRAEIETLERTINVLTASACGGAPATVSGRVEQYDPRAVEVLQHQLREALTELDAHRLQVQELQQQLEQQELLGAAGRGALLGGALSRDGSLSGSPRASLSLGGGEVSPMEAAGVAGGTAAAELQQQRQAIEDERRELKLQVSAREENAPVNRYGLVKSEPQAK